MKPSTYTPRGGLVAKVLHFLQANPDESLTVSDIATKFDAVRGNVTTLLSPATKAGMLVRTLNEEAKDYVYELGAAAPAQAATAQAAAKAPSTRVHQVDQKPMTLPQKPVKALDVPTSVRFGLFTDGALQIEDGDASMRLDAASVQGLVAYLGRAMPAVA